MGYHKERKSLKWKKLDSDFKREVKIQKQDFYKNMIADLKSKKPSQWYSALKRISGLDEKSLEVKISEINHFDDKEQAEVLADYFAQISNEYEALKSSDIDIPVFSDSEIPQFKPNQIWHHLT